MHHTTLQANGVSFHVAQTGHGAPLLFLHGWPVFWLTWEPVMTRLEDRFQLIAPDLRGFGDSDKPQGPFGATDHAADILGLLDALKIDRGAVWWVVRGETVAPMDSRFELIGGTASWALLQRSRSDQG